MGCTFCATGTMGLTADLTAGEIVEQLVHANGVMPVRNVVFMVSAPGLHSRLLPAVCAACWVPTVPPAAPAGSEPVKWHLVVTWRLWQRCRTCWLAVGKPSEEARFCVRTQPRNGLQLVMGAVPT